MFVLSGISEYGGTILNVGSKLEQSFGTNTDGK